jgi:phosphatidylinositol alpha-1,6-mannosyltransferase
MVARKGQDMLIRALPEIRRRVPGAALLLVGDGPHRRSLQRLTHRLGLAEHVVFTGRIPWPATPAYYDAGTVFCMPTRTRLGGLEPEALGICYLEAAATGLPVVAGDSGGAPDAVLDGESGYVVDGRDVAAVADRCARLLADPDLAARMGRRGRAWVAEQWRWDDLAARLRSLLSGTPVDPAT